MEERNDSGERVVDEVMLPGFRFHPTDEELVGFYLKRKIQQRPLSIELIKQLDIYKYNPWDLPKLSSSGEKEWYFYCPRDRKYRNSARPNRVTRAGFWKATGTDRPIYSSEGSSSKCIGLKKSLVFYKGRAAKGVKTDWMMHEFRLPSLTDSYPKKYMDHKTNIPANESWAICRIFKKTNATAQRALSHSWVPPLHETTTTSDVLSNDGDNNNNQFCSANMTKKPTFPMSQFCTTAANHNDTQVHYLTTTSSSTTLCPLDNVASYYKPIINPLTFKPFDRLPISTNGDLISTASALFETSTNCTKSSNMDVSSLLLSMSSSVLGDFSKTPSNGLQDQHIINNNGYPIMPLQREMMQLQGTICNNQDDESVLLPLVKVPSCVNVPRGGDEQMPFNIIGDAWKSSILWDTSSCATSDDAPSGYSTTKCYST